MCGLPESDGQWLFAHWEGNGFTTIRAWKAQGDIFPSQKQPQKELQRGSIARSTAKTAAEADHVGS
jgi:hypothetical protein